MADIKTEKFLTQCVCQNFIVLGLFTGFNRCTPFLKGKLEKKRKKLIMVKLTFNNLKWVLVKMSEFSSATDKAK